MTTLAFLGGTGDQGRGLARRFALAGHSIVLGSRSTERATAAAQSVLDGLPAGAQVAGVTNAEAAEAGELVVVAVPYEGHADLLRSVAAQLTGKIVIDCVNPLGFDERGAFALE